MSSTEKGSSGAKWLIGGLVFLGLIYLGGRSNAGGPPYDPRSSAADGS